MEIHLTFKINGSTCNESKTIWSKVKHDAILGNKKNQNLQDKMGEVTEYRMFTTIRQFIIHPFK